jgi:hypothetical protein
MVERLKRVRFELFLAASLVMVGWCVNATNHGLEVHPIARPSDGDVGALPDGKTLRVASLGFERLVADLFWIRTVSYVGDEVASDHLWPGAERLAMLVTDIDPHFDSAYVVMASVLNGLRKDPDAALRLLEKGAAVSSYWRIHFLLGFQYFMEKQDYVRGAQSLQRALDLGGPVYLQFLISRLYSSAGDPTTAMHFIELRLQNEENDQVREQLVTRYSDLWITRDLDAINAAIEKYRAANHGDPKNVRALLDAKLLAELPHDPKGGEYGISDGRASTRIPYELMRLKEQRH